MVFRFHKLNVTLDRGFKVSGECLKVLLRTSGGLLGRFRRRYPGGCYRGRLDALQDLRKKLSWASWGSLNWPRPGTCGYPAGRRIVAETISLIYAAI